MYSVAIIAFLALVVFFNLFGSWALGGTNRPANFMREVATAEVTARL